MTRNFTTDPLRIDILAADSCRGAILYGMYELLESAGTAWSYLTEGAPGRSITRVRIVARHKDPFRCIAGVPVIPYADLDEADDAEIICLPN